jgi:16S rRNA (cytosine1402-N4)-methyltransferase
MMESHHTPVLLKESLDFLITDKSGIYFDGTLGFGGHSENILKELNDSGLLVATDIDLDAFNFSKKKFSRERRMKIFNYNFAQINLISKIESIDNFTGIFADLGVSSFQLDNPSSGFTYREDAKLDLRMDKTRAVSAADIVNSYAEEDIADILYKYGEEKNSRRIAHKILEKRKINKIESTQKLKEIISEITPPNFLAKSLSRVFQALRIYVNDELGVLKTFLNDSVSLLRKGGRIVILTYHSLEDRIVKDQFKYETLDCICPKDFPVCKCDKERRLNILTKKPIVPSDNEIKLNIRSRSAKLRVAERV